MTPGFSWPMDSLAIVAPIIFIVLTISFPLIGLAVGWKRAAFWGVGNFFFFILGLIIWKTLAPQMTAPLTDFVASLIHGIKGCSDVTVTPELVQSVLAPFYFLIVMAIGELLLLINYYAWYKRVVGLKKIKVKDSKTGKITKKYTKINKKAGTVGYKVGNRLGGLVLLGALTVPSTIAFTQMIYYVTTSSATRLGQSIQEENGEEKNEEGKVPLSQSLYLALEKYNSFMGWFCYYGSDPTGTGSTYDSIFSAIHLLTHKITDLEGNETTVMEEVEAIIGKGIGGLSDYLPSAIEGGTEEKEAFANAFNDISDKWNNIVDQAEADLTAIFASDTVVEQINAILQPMIEDMQKQEGAESGGFEVDQNIFETLFVPSEQGKQSQFDQIIDEYVNNSEILGIKITKFEPVEIPLETFEMVSDIFTELIQVGEDVEDPEKVETVVAEGFKSLLQLLFIPVPK